MLEKVRKFPDLKKGIELRLDYVRKTGKDYRDFCK